MRKSVTCAAVFMLAAGGSTPVSAQPVTFELGDLTFPRITTTGDAVLGWTPLDTPAGRDFTTARVDFFWRPAVNNNASATDAIWGLSDSPPDVPPTFFYLDPGPALNVDVATLGARQAPTPARWATVSRNPIPGGESLFFTHLQTNHFTDVTWENVRVTLDDRPLSFGMFAGDTTDAPLWRRPLDRRADAGPGSTTRNNLAYEVVPFFVDTDGVYSLTTSTDFTATGGGRWNGVGIVYQDAFDPAFPERNLLGHKGIDPTTINFAPREVSFDLEADRQYFFVQTGRLGRGTGVSSDRGPWSGEWVGEGGLTFGIVPEPAAASLLAVGGMILLRRTRRIG